MYQPPIPKCTKKPLKRYHIRQFTGDKGNSLGPRAIYWVNRPVPQSIAVGKLLCQCLIVHVHIAVLKGLFHYCFYPMFKGVQSSTRTPCNTNITEACEHF